MLEGAKSPSGPSPPPHMMAAMYGERHLPHHFPMNKDHLTHGPEHYTQQKNLPPIVSALFQNSAMEKSGNACELLSHMSLQTFGWDQTFCELQLFHCTADSEIKTQSIFIILDSWVRLGLF